MVPFAQAGAPIRGRWAEHAGELQACPDCGYLAFSPLPSEQVLGEYYSSQYWELGGSAQEARALQPASDGKRLISENGTYVMRALHFVPVGRTLRLIHVLEAPADAGSGMRQFEVGLMMPSDQNDEYEVAIRHKGTLYLQKRLRGGYRYSEAVRLRAEAGDEVHLEVRTLASPWPSLYLHASSEWLSATSPMHEPVVGAAS